LAVRLRLRRIGKKKLPVYQIVAADSRSARTGKVLEVIGRYDPLKSPMLVSAQEDRVMRWLKHGALPTNTVRSLFRRTGLWLKWSLTKKGLDETAIATEMEKWQMMQVEKHQRELARKARRKAEHRKKKKASQVEAPAAPPAAAEAPAQA
jgi:small subunit ribosomal protein S16